jgi:excisionase family DNA binding protein
MTDADRDYLTVKEYADRLGVHIQTVYSAIRRGLLKREVERVGRTIRIYVSRGSISDRKAS